MAAGLLQRGKITFYNPLFSEGVFVTNCDPDEPGATSRTNKKKRKKEDEYGFFFQIFLQDAKETVALTLPYDAFQTRLFFNALLSAPQNALKGVFTIYVNFWKKDGKPNAFLNVHLADDMSLEKETRLAPRYERNELPEGDKVIIAGKERTDFSQMTAFLWQKVQENILPFLPSDSDLLKVHPPKPRATQADSSPDEVTTDMPPDEANGWPLSDDDIPF